ncbi:hypothetical protein RDI58_022492 [Solanum bulbocastanum]|uniref:ER lumen protein retaining receptor n=1 Tax=Solanum bulbocastanum TaxID=147425 RepID=A0AAN8T9D6_SOLBU
MGEKGLRTPARKVFLWVRKQSKKVKTVLGAVTCLTLLITLRLLIHDHNHFFVLAELVHFIGILCLIYKLSTLKTCSATLWVIYMMKFKLKSSFMADLDNMHYWYLIVPCAVAAFLIHPATAHNFFFRVLWAFCVYMESISVLPQLRLMQNVQIIEPFTAHYVFALGVARFLGCAHWINQVYDTSGAYLYLAGRGYFWIPMVFLAEIVQTFILADFCYYYIKSVMSGQLLVRLPQPV